jgi:putative ABC transport system permease protein
MLRLFFSTALRNLQRNRILSTIKITGLSLGMLCMLVTWLYYQHEMSYDRYPNSDRVFRYVHRVNLPEGMQEYAVTAAVTGPALQERYPEVQSVCRILEQPLFIRAGKMESSVYEEKFLFADSTFFDFFPLIESTADEHLLLKGPFTVVLSPRAAKKYFGNGDPIGKSLITDDETAFIVTGVLTAETSKTHLGMIDFIASFESLELMGRKSVWAKTMPATVNLAAKGYNTFYTYLMLKADGDESTLVNKFPSFIEDFRGKGKSERLKPTLQPLKEIHLHSNLMYEIDKNGSETSTKVLLVIGVVILFIANVNFINISTAEFIKKARSVGIQKLLGTSRSALVASIFVEAFLLSLIAVMMAFILLYCLIPYINVLFNRQLEIDPVQTVYFGLIVAVACAFLSGVYPAMYINKVSPAEVVRSRFAAAGNVSNARNGLVFVQLVVSFLLVSGTLLIHHQVEHLLNKDLGYDQHHLLAINTRGTDYADVLPYQSEIARVGGVEDVSLASEAFGIPGAAFAVMLPESGDEERRYSVLSRSVDPGYLRVIKTSLVAGRFFETGIAADSLTNVVINEIAAETLFNGDAINKVIEVPSVTGAGGTVRMTVIGVVADYHFASLREVIQPLVIFYEPKQFNYVLVRYAEEEPRQLIQALHSKWKQVFPAKAFEYQMVDQHNSLLYQDERDLKNLVLSFALIAALIGAMGIFGTGLFIVEQRTREFGIRKVFGADVLKLILIFAKPLMILLVLAFVISVPVGYVLSERWLMSFPYRTTVSFDLFVIAFFAILGILLLTLMYHFRRLTRLNAVDVLMER